MGYNDDFELDEQVLNDIHPTPPLGGSQELSFQKS